MNLELYSGIGNRFLLTEQAELLPQAAELARALCSAGQVRGERVDGLLVLEDRPGEIPRMTIFNGDGSRPGACGNGLRCVGWHLARKHGRKENWVETDSGRRLVRLLDQTGDRATLTSDMGQVELAKLSEPVPQLPGLIATRRAWLGNPHAVLLVQDERDLDAPAIAQEFHSHPDFPEGVNVGLLAERSGAWFLRVHERGVGETEACGTGATAAASVLAELGRIPALGEVTLQMSGGELRVTLRPDSRADLQGEALALGPLDPRQLSSCGVPWAISSQF